MSRYRGPRFKKTRRLGALPGLTRKKYAPKIESRTPPRSGKKISILYSSRRKTKIATSNCVPTNGIFESRLII